MPCQTVQHKYLVGFLIQPAMPVTNIHTDKSLEYQALSKHPKLA